MAGVLMQALFRNPVADAWSLGLLAGGQLGVALIVTAAAFAGPAAVSFLTFFEGPSITLAAAASVAIAALVMLALGRRVGAITLLVIGLMLGFTAQGLTSVLLHFAARAGGRIYGGWQDASFAGVVPAVLPWLLLPIARRARRRTARPCRRRHRACAVGAALPAPECGPRHRRRAGRDSHPGLLTGREAVALMLDLQSLAVGYRNTRGAILSGIDLSAGPGDFICILGRNAAGKSTLMRTIAGLQASLDGIVLLDGEDIASMRPATRARRIAVVLTERQFNPGLRVDDVIALARQPFTGWQGGLADNDAAAIADAVAVTGVEPFLRRHFSDLSDGERQRVMIARALAQTPRLMVLDEITAFLDLPSRVEIMALLRSRARQKGQVVLLSSHDLDLSLQLSDSVWLLDGAGGFSVGTPDELSRSGTVGRAFDTDAIRFSPSHGRFEISM